MQRFPIVRRSFIAFGLGALLSTSWGCRMMSHQPLMRERLPPREATVSTEEAIPPGQNSSRPSELQPIAHAETSVNHEIAVSLNEAITTALSNNPHLLVIAALPEEVGKRTEIERAQFDPSTNTNAQYLQGTQQVASALQAVRGGLGQYSTTSFGPAAGSPNLLSMEQRFSTGTFARIGVGSNYNYYSPVGQYLIYNPAYQSAGSLILEQALFRGASREANLAGIHIAQTSEKQSAAEFQVEVNQTLAEVQRAYWLAWLTESQRKTCQEFVDQAQTTYDLEQRRFELGEGGIIQSAQATENLHSLKGELAQAQQRSRAARNRLLALMGVSPDNRLPLKMTDEPSAQPVVTNLDQGLATALQDRPEMQVRQLQVRQAQLELDRRKNNERPDVRVYAGYSLTGLNNNLNNSFNQFSTGQFGTMSLGMRYSYAWGQRAERAAAEQAELALSRQLRAKRETEFLIQQQVRDASDAVNSAWEVSCSQQARVKAARVQAETFHQLHAAGQIDLDRLLRARQQLSSALQQSHAALIDYNLAICSWRLATGMMTVPMTSREVEAADSVFPNDQPPKPLPPLPPLVPEFDQQP